jgi:Ca2+-binding EF-hand superfamily protein
VLNYNEFIKKILPADYPKRSKVYADDMASLAFEDRKRPHQDRLIITAREFETQFREALQQRSAGGGSEMAKQFKMFDTTGRGFVTIDDLMAAARSWNLTPTAQVEEQIKRAWVKPGNLETGVIEYYDFVNKVLPSDFKNAKDVMRVFQQKMQDNFKHMQEAFMQMDKDRSGKVDRAELLVELGKMNIHIPADIAETFLDQLDADGDGEIDFDEFANAVASIDAEQASSGGIGQIWDGDQNVKKR